MEEDLLLFFFIFYSFKEISDFEKSFLWLLMTAIYVNSVDQMNMGLKL